MKKQILGISIVSLLVVSYAFAWWPPTAPPPGDNVPAPLNVSSITQGKLGNLGIGSSDFLNSPSGKALRITDVINNPELQLKYGTGYSDHWAAYIEQWDNSFRIWRSDDKLTILQNGNVGIGTAEPGAKLEIAGQVKITGGSPGAGKVLTSDTYGLASWQTPSINGNGGGYWTQSGFNLYSTDTSWDVGIGTTSPSTKLHIVGGARITGLANCNTIDTDADGNLFCGTDETGTGNGAGLWTDAGTYIYPNNYTYFIITDIGNVGIGTTSPGTKLDIVGQIKIRGGNPGAGKVLTSDTYGLASWQTPSINGNGGGYWTQSGFNLYSTDTSWDVGIGTTSPGAKLEIAGQVKITGGSPGEGKVLTSDISGLASWQDMTGNGGGLPEGGEEDQTLRHDGIGWVASNSLYNDNTNVGIGTTEPNKLLHLKTGAGTNAELDIQSGEKPHWGIYQDENSGQLRFWNAGLETAEPETAELNRMVITDIGYVGIGTTNPSWQLHILGETTSSMFVDSGTGDYDAQLNFGKVGTVEAQLRWDYGDDRIAFWSNTGGDTVSILDNGQVGIGTTEPKSMAKLHIADGKTFDTNWNPYWMQDCPAIIESSQNAFINIRTPNDAYGGILFTDPDRPEGLAEGAIWSPPGYVEYFHDPNYEGMHLGAGGATRMWINSDGDIRIGSDADQQPGSNLSIRGTVEITEPLNALIVPKDKLRLDVQGKVKITGGEPGEGKVLTSDAEGLASWQDVAGIGGGGYWTKSDSNLYPTDTGLNVGINTDNPLCSLDVRNVLCVNNPTDQGVLVISGKGDENRTFSALYLGNNEPDYTLDRNSWFMAYKKEVGQPNEDSLAFGRWEGSSLLEGAIHSIKMTILPDGRVGIGKIHPWAKLDIFSQARTPPEKYKEGQWGPHTERGVLHLEQDNECFMSMRTSDYGWNGITFENWLSPEKIAAVESAWILVKHNPDGHYTSMKISAGAYEGREEPLGDATVFIDSDGKVGIGTSNPKSRLSLRPLVDETVARVTMSTNDKALFIGGGSGTDSSYGSSVWLYGNDNIINKGDLVLTSGRGNDNDDIGDIRFVTANALYGAAGVGSDQRMVIKANSGKVGIGTAEPQAELHVAGRVKISESVTSLSVPQALTVGLDVAGQVKIGGGDPGEGKVLTSIDDSGLASWQDGAGNAFAKIANNEGAVMFSASGEDTLRMASGAGLSIFYGFLNEKAVSYSLSNMSLGCPAGEVLQKIWFDGVWQSVCVPIGPTQLPDPIPVNGQILISDGVNWVAGNEMVITEVGNISIVGNVGIGTTEPNKLLHLKAVAGVNAEIDIQSGNSSHWGIYQDEATEGLRFWNSDNRLVLTKDGKVGVGTTSPAAAFEIETTFNIGSEAFIIDQNDTDQAFVDYQGISATDYTANISTAQGQGVVEGPKNKGMGVEDGWNFAGMTKIEINGQSFWMPYYGEDPAL